MQRTQLFKPSTTRGEDDATPQMAADMPADMPADEPVRQPAPERRAAPAPAPASAPAAPAGPTLMQRIKDKLPLIDYVKRFREMKQSPGTQGEFYGKCISPDHADDGPSFYVSTQKQVFHCKGCGISGNVVGAYAILNNMADDDAKFALGRELGVVNERRMDDAESMLAKAAGRYAWQLERKEDAVAYLVNERGLTVETIQRFGLGFCWGSEHKDATPEQRKLAIETGLARQPDPATPDAPLRSFMAGRITFPVKDRSGRVVGFAGRLAPSSRSNGPKYLNTPETQYFHKSDLLYGANEALSGIARAGYATVVEGYMDVIALHQCTVDNVVAVMGASANEATFKQLWSMTKRVVFCLDGDAAGDTGALRSVLAAAPTMEDGCEIAIARLPAGVDPDEFVLRHGSEAFDQLCEQATPLSRFLMIARSHNHDLSYPEGRARFLEDARQVAANFSKAPLVQEQIVSEARGLSAAALVNVALQFAQVPEDAGVAELRDAIALMKRRVMTLESSAAAPAAAEQAPAATAAEPAPARQAMRPR
jgi:DNA primase